jgi:plasmid stabilization system protein ParE
LKVRYTPDAIADLREALAYIEKQSPQGARKVYARIQRLINLTLDHPQMGARTSSKRRCPTDGVVSFRSAPNAGTRTLRNSFTGLAVAHRLLVCEWQIILWTTRDIKGQKNRKSNTIKDSLVSTEGRVWHKRTPFRFPCSSQEAILEAYSRDRESARPSRRRTLSSSTTTYPALVCVCVPVPARGKPAGWSNIRLEPNTAA